MWSPDRARSGFVRASATSTYIVLYGLSNEPAARDLAAALHAALYGYTKALTLFGD
ncbi:hypothetical protein [Streptomyces flavidovirens]